MKKTLSQLFEAQANMNKVRDKIFDIISSGDNLDSIEQMIEDGNKAGIIAAVAIFNALDAGGDKELKREGQKAIKKLVEPE